MRRTSPIWRRSAATRSASRRAALHDPSPDGEARMIRRLEAKYQTDMFTSSQNQVNVLRAMKLKKILGITAFRPDMNKSYAKYFEDCGIGVVAMEGTEFRSARFRTFRREHHLHQEEVPGAPAGRFHLHPGIGSGCARHRGSARAGSRRSGGAADRRPRLGDPAPPARPPADQRLRHPPGDAAGIGWARHQARETAPEAALLAHAPHKVLRHDVLAALGQRRPLVHRARNLCPRPTRPKQRPVAP